MWSSLFSAPSNPIRVPRPRPRAKICEWGQAYLCYPQVVLSEPLLPRRSPLLYTSEAHCSLVKWHHGVPSLRGTCILRPMSHWCGKLCLLTYSTCTRCLMCNWTYDQRWGQEWSNLPVLKRSSKKDINYPVVPAWLWELRLGDDRGYQGLGLTSHLGKAGETVHWRWGAVGFLSPLGCCNTLWDIHKNFPAHWMCLLPRRCALSWSPAAGQSHPEEAEGCALQNHSGTLGGERHTHGGYERRSWEQVDEEQFVANLFASEQGRLLLGTPYHGGRGQWPGICQFIYLCVRSDSKAGYFTGSPGSHTWCLHSP